MAALAFVQLACKQDAPSAADAGPSISASAAAPASSASSSAAACAPPNVIARTKEPGNPLKCVRTCTSSGWSNPCPEDYLCTSDATNERGERQFYCVFDKDAPPRVQCTAPEVMVYAEDRNVAFCGKPCKTSADCRGGKTCGNARKHWEATIGMRMAVANDISVCK